MITTYKNRGGKIVVIKGMDDSYLINAIRFFRKRVPEMEETINACWGCCFHGEIAQNFQDEDLKDMEKSLGEVEDLLKALKQENLNRNI
jgi:hypothetical protein